MSWLDFWTIRHHSTIAISLGQFSTVGASGIQRVRNNLTELQRRFPMASGRLGSYTSGVTVVTGTGLTPGTGRFGGNRRAGLYSHMKELEDLAQNLS